MRARLVVACSALLMVMALWMVGAGSGRIAAQEAPAAKKHFLEVGKKYQFIWALVNLDVKILEEPHDRFVKVIMLGEEKPKEQWVNLDQVLFIEAK